MAKRKFYKIDEKGNVTFRPIRICKENLDKIDEIIEAAEGKSTARCINAYWVLEYAEEIANRLHIPAKYMTGVTAECDPHGQRFANAYKYAPMSTHFDIRYTKNKAYLTAVYRDYCGGCTQHAHVYLPDEAKEAVLDSMRWMDI